MHKYTRQYKFTEEISLLYKSDFYRQSSRTYRSRNSKFILSKCHCPYGIDNFQMSCHKDVMYFNNYQKYAFSSKSEAIHLFIFPRHETPIGKY